MLANTLKLYQKRTIRNLCDFISLESSHILDLGGRKNDPVAQFFLDNGISKLTTINIDKNIQNVQLNDNYSIIKMDARQLEFDDNYFDAVHGSAVLEHLNDLDVVLQQLYRCVKQGGFVCLHGGPLWSCGLGHHLWVHCEGMKYEFNGYNPVPNFSHLYYSKEEMKNFLIEEGIKNIHAEKISEMIYDSEMVNRLGYTSIKQTIIESQFSLVSMREDYWGGYLSESVQQALLKSGNSPKENFRVGAVCFLLKK